VRRYLPFFLLLANLQFLPAADHLVIISPHWEGIRVEITKKFQKWYREKYGQQVNLDWIDQGGTSDDLRLVESLFQKNPSGIDIDIFFGGGLDPYLRLKEKGLLQRYVLDKKILKDIPESCLGVPNYDPEGYWYGVVLSSFGILYNKKVLDYLKLPYPATWEDLARPEYFSWVGAADPRHSGSMHMMYEIILQAYGWEKGWKIILSLAGNTRHFSSSASQVARATALGDVAISLCIDSYALAQIQVNGSENIDFALPELTVINPDAIAILKGATNLTTARRFLEFLLSEKGQLVWMLPPGAEDGPEEFALNRLSIRPKTYQHPGVLFGKANPYLRQSFLRYDFSLAGKRWTLLNDLLGACVIDCHTELKRAWRLVTVCSKQHLWNQFYQLPIKPVAQRFFWENWSDPVFRNQYLTRWLNLSREKFTMVAKEIKYLYGLP